MSLFLLRFFCSFFCLSACFSPKCASICAYLSPCPSLFGSLVSPRYCLFRDICLEGSSSVAKRPEKAWKRSSVFTERWWAISWCSVVRIAFKSAVRFVSVVEINSLSHLMWQFYVSDTPHTCPPCGGSSLGLTASKLKRENSHLEIFDLAAAAVLVSRSSLCSCVLIQLSSEFYTNVSNTAKIKCELGPFPSAGFKHIYTPPECKKKTTTHPQGRNGSQEKTNRFKNWKLLGKLQLTFTVTLFMLSFDDENK